MMLPETYHPRMAPGLIVLGFAFTIAVGCFHGRIYDSTPQ